MSTDLNCPMDLKEKINHREMSSSFTESLTSLNATFLVWINQEVGKNPTVILLPIFKLYEQKFEELLEQFPTSSEHLNSETINQEEYETNKSEAKEETAGSQRASIQNYISTLELSESFTLQETQSKHEENVTSQLEMSEPLNLADGTTQHIEIVSSCKSVPTPTVEGE